MEIENVFIRNDLYNMQMMTKKLEESEQNRTE